MRFTSAAPKTILMLVALQAIFTEGADLSNCNLRLPGFASSWVDRDPSDSDGTLHGEILGRKTKGRKGRIELILPHFASDSAFLSRNCLPGPSGDAVYPEAYLYDRRAWELMRDDSSAYVCRGSLSDCIDSTRAFRVRAQHHWSEVAHCNPLRLQLRVGKQEGWIIDKFLEMKSLTQAQADSILAYRCPP